VDTAEIMGHVVHNLLRMNVVVAKQIDVIVLSGEGAVLSPVVGGRVQPQSLDSVRPVGRGVYIREYPNPPLTGDISHCQLGEKNMKGRLEK
jgi:hypothetical protein